MRMILNVLNLQKQKKKKLVEHPTETFQEKKFHEQCLIMFLC